MNYDKYYKKGAFYEIPTEIFNNLLSENEELKKQLHECSLEIQSQIESTLACPSNCDNMKLLQKKLDKAIEMLIASEYKQFLINEKGKETIKEYWLRYIEQELENE